MMVQNELSKREKAEGKSSLFLVRSTYKGSCKLISSREYMMVQNELSKRVEAEKRVATLLYSMCLHHISLALGATIPS